MKLLRMKGNSLILVREESESIGFISLLLVGQESLIYPTSVFPASASYTVWWHLPDMNNEQRVEVPFCDGLLAIQALFLAL